MVMSSNSGFADCIRECLILPDRLKTIVIGGSNTVITRGYIDTLLHSCRQQGLPIDVIADHAVGNTTIGYGLMLLKREPMLATADLLLIEYAINDDFAYNVREDLLRHWSRLYEGVIRYARTINPRIRILTILLDTRTGEWAHRVPQIASRTYYICHTYDAWFCDVNRDILRAYGPSVLEDEGFYATGDSAHYARPIATAIVGKNHSVGPCSAFQDAR